MVEENLLEDSNHSLADSHDVSIETNAPNISHGNLIAERGFGIVIDVARSIVLGSPYPSPKLWAETVKAAAYIRNRTLTDILEGKAIERRTTWKCETIT